MVSTPKRAQKVRKPSSSRAAKVRRAARKRKNLILDQGKINRAKEIFGVATETEAIHRALDAASDLASLHNEVQRRLPDLLGRGGFTDHFPSSVPPQTR